MGKKILFFAIMCISLALITILYMKSFFDVKQNEIILGDKILIGDVDGNDKVETRDYLLVRKHILGVETLKGDKLSRADIDGKSGIGTGDYIAIRKIIISGEKTYKEIKSTKSPVEYTIVFDANGGNVSPGSKVYEEGSTYGSMPTPTRTGYKFVGWFKVASGSFDYEYYSKNNKELNDEYGYNEKKLKEHWYDRGRDKEAKTCSADSISTAATVTGNTTLYAGWERESDSFVITHYWGIDSPYIDDTQARYLKDAGFNLVMLSGGTNYKTHDAYVAGVGKALKKLDNYGLDAIVVGWKVPIHFDDPNETDAKREGYIKETINDFKNYPNVKEYFVGDEPPSKAYFAAIDKIMDYINKNDSKRKGTMSLLPGGLTPGDYRKDYLIPYARDVSANTLSFDRYVFAKSGTVDKVNFYENLEQVYYVAKEYGKIPTAIVLVTEHLEYKNLTENDIAFEASVSVAYGMKRISYFTYSVDEITKDGFTNAMLNINHDRTTHYYNVRDVNKWLKKIGNELYNANMLEVYGFNESSLVSYSKYGSGISASQAGIISMYDNKNYLLVNTAIQENKDNVFTFNSFDGVEFYDINTNKWVKITGNYSSKKVNISYSNKKITIAPGHCILLRGGSYWRSGGSWQKDSSGYRHFTDPNGIAVKSDLIKSKGYWYYMTSSGVMGTGWQKLNNKWYYFNSSGERQIGWIKDNGKWYYLNTNGVMQTGVATINSKKYCFDSSGVMQTSWCSYNNKWYYANTDGELLTGWKEIDKKWYYLNSDGVMQTGLITLNGKKYYLDSSGVMQTGWQEVDKKWYFFESDGSAKTGWLSNEGKYYYLNSDGVMQTGLITVNGKKYYLDSYGVMQTGWQEVDKKWYYFESSGEAKIGWLSYNDKWYFFNSDGTMVAGQCKTIDGKEYCFDDSGAMK